MANHNPAGFPVQVGINNVGSYQVSGRPFATGSCSNGGSGAATPGYVYVKFPYVTRWFQIINKSHDPLRVAFSFEGLNIADSGSENFHFDVPASSSGGGYGMTPCYEMKVSGLYCEQLGASPNGTFDVVAGLTSIDARRTDKNFTGSYTGV